MEKLIIPSILTVSDVVNLTDNVLKITLPGAPVDSKFGILYEKNKQIFDRLVKNQKSSLKSEFTDELVTKDKRRDMAYMALRDIILEISISLIEDMAARGTKLYSIIEKLGTNIYRLGYKAESAILLSLFVEFDKPENQQLLSELGILAYYNSLKEAQVVFDSVSTQKVGRKDTAKQRYGSCNTGFGRNDTGFNQPGSHASTLCRTRRWNLHQHV